MVMIKWCSVRYLHLVKKIIKRIRKIHKDFVGKLDFKYINFSIKIRDIYKIEKKNCISISVFGYEKRQKFAIYVSKNTLKRHVDLLLTEQGGQPYYLLINNFSSFMFNQILHCDRKHICCYCFQSLVLQKY